MTHTTNNDEYLRPMVTHSDDQVVPEAGEPKACTHPSSRITRTPFQQIDASGMKGNEVITGMRLRSNTHLVQAVSGRVHEMEDDSLEMGKPLQEYQHLICSMSNQTRWKGNGKSSLQK
jgi:hypothetical protein